MTLHNNPANQTVQLPPAPALPFTLKASATQYRKSIGMTRVAAALGLSLVFWVKLGFLGWFISVVGIAAIIIVVIFLLTRRSITVNNDGVHYKNAFGVTKSVLFEEVASVEVFENYLEPGFGVMPRIILAKKSGGYLFSTIGLFWPYTESSKLLSSLKDNKVLLNVHTDPAQSSTIAKEFPNLVPYYERHPYWIAVIIAFLIIVAVAIAVILFVM